MTKLDDRLSAAFAPDAPPARDPAFTAKVLQRIEQRGLLIDLAFQAALALAAGGLLWGLWPTLAPVLRDWAPTVGSAATVLGVVLSLLFADRVLEQQAARR
jgi:hypothetical protein